MEGRTPNFSLKLESFPEGKSVLLENTKGPFVAAFFKNDLWLCVNNSLFAAMG
jgi:hypothetical protein